MLLSNKAAIVTGAGRGIGRAIAMTLAAQGAKVVVNDYGVDSSGHEPSSEPANEVVELIREAGGTAIAHTGSVADAEAVSSLVGGCVEAFGRVDILVNNAGIIIRNLLIDTPEEDWDRVVAVHLRGSYLTTKAAAPHMMAQNFGRIINFTSAAGLLSYPGSNAYTAAKGGVLSFTRLLAQELGFHGVTANAIAPSAATRMSGNTPAAVEQVRRALGLTTRGAGPPEERTPDAVAAAVAYLASDEAQFINGQVIGVRGRQLDVWSAPAITHSVFSDAPWTVEALKERMPETLGKFMSNPPRSL